jgi:hypothetical protein
LSRIALLRCGEREHRIPLRTRDVQLLDARYFLRGGWAYRALFGLDFIRGLGAPPLATVLKTHHRAALILQIRGMLQALEDQRDLITYSYQYSFSALPRQRHSAGRSGFRVQGYVGDIDARPSGWCDLTLSERTPTGRGRVVTIIDFRARKEIETDDLGTLRIHRRREPVGWFDVLPPLLEWLETADESVVQVLHVRGTSRLPNGLREDLVDHRRWKWRVMSPGHKLQVPSAPLDRVGE